MADLGPVGGYSIRHHVFERTEMARALEMLAAAEMERTRAGARHVRNVPIVRELAEDRRLLAIASHFVGRSAFPAPSIIVASRSSICAI